MRISYIAAAVLLAISSPAMSNEAKQGEETYQRYCASCHGLEGTGHGPMRPVLLTMPADLTKLSAGNNGAFPLIRVIKRIDGRDPLVSHGSPMPVYGDFFDLEKSVSLKTESGQLILTSQPVAELVAYLKQLQNGAE